MDTEVLEVGATYIHSYLYLYSHTVVIDVIMKTVLAYCTKKMLFITHLCFEITKYYFYNYMPE